MTEFSTHSRAKIIICETFPKILSGSASGRAFFIRHCFGLTAAGENPYVNYRYVNPYVNYGNPYVNPYVNRR